MNVAIAIHGGAGNILPQNFSTEKIDRYKVALRRIVREAYARLCNHESALDVVEQAVVCLEDCGLFNAGKGAALNALGDYELDASLMEGKTGRCGSVAMVQRIKNPISLARAVMDKTPHVFLGGKGAEAFAQSLGIPSVDKSYFYDETRYKQWKKIAETAAVEIDQYRQGNGEKHGTVGAVALDSHGNLAAATSTGGMINKMQGRIGDSPLIGAATYANNSTCAVSCTGHGEIFIRQVVAYDVHCLMQYKEMTLQDACDVVVQQKLVAAQGEGGLIAVDARGNVVLSFNTPGMFRAAKTTASEQVNLFR